MDIAHDGEEIDQNLYLGLCPLLPNLSIDLFSRTQPSFMEEDSSDPLITTIDPVLPSTPNFTINENPTTPASQISNEGLLLEQDNFSPILQIRDDVPGLQLGLSMLIPVSDLVINGSQVDRVSSRERLQEYPQLRFERLMEVNRTGIGTGTGRNHPDTSPQRLMNNILALEASRKERLKNGKGHDTTRNEKKKNGEGTCNCGADFECNICFETSIDPVVTPCGHLFCWRCLYKWIRTQLLGISECPVCKGEVTESSLTPIYGRGGSGSSSVPDPVPGMVMEEIPPRPSGKRIDSTRQLMRREREVRGRGVGIHEVERVRIDLEAVLARLRQMPRSNRGGTGIAGSGTAVEVFAGGLMLGSGSGLAGEEVGEGGGGEGRGEGDRLESGAASSVAGEMHVRRRRRYR